MNAPTERVGSKGKVSLYQAIAANVLNMVGIGPFLTVPLILSAMGGPQAMIGWAIGALIAVCDGLVWAELGAAMPGSGGSYQYLLEAYGPRTGGRLMSFLFLIQTIVAAPLTTASGGVGFASYAHFLFPNMTGIQTKAVAIGICLLATWLLYRNIRSIGKISMWMFYGVMGTMGWIIFAGATHFHPSLAFSFPPGAFHLSKAFFLGLGAASLLAMYDYSGYFTVCLIGDEVDRPAVNIPRCILISVGMLAVFYTAMSLSIIGVVPWREAMRSDSIVSEFISRVYGPGAAQLSAVLIMIAAFGSVFTVMLGYSRVPYAAAVEGHFFSIFARVDPKGGFPSFSVLSMGVTSAAACLLSLDSLIKALLVIQVMIWFIPQCIAVVLIRKKRPDIRRPFLMYLYPLPVVIALAGWIFIFGSSGPVFIEAGFITLGLAVAAYLLRARAIREWPFQPRVPVETSVKL